MQSRVDPYPIGGEIGGGTPLYARGGRFSFLRPTPNPYISYTWGVEIVRFLMYPFLVTLRQISSISYA